VPVGPRLVSVRFASAARDQILVTYDKPITGGGAVLYRVVAGGAPVNIASASTAGDTVTLQLAWPASGSTLLSYGYGRAPQSPWVVATDGTGAAYAFADVPVQP